MISSKKTTLLEDFFESIKCNLAMQLKKRHFPASRQQGLVKSVELHVRYEEKGGRSQPDSDNLRKISIKMVTLETNDQNAMPVTWPSNLEGGRGGKRMRFLEFGDEVVMRPPETNVA
ncbi:hypothetical protein ACH5RR_002033 [Cinchona calisaya]|uniref:Uncharacterized protein n=1 Tax=Cinchona calisaya TaxID=153742 RepID=A0ABD3B533_9GENT